MAEFTLAKLKGMLDDGELDLSACGLTSIPKALYQLQRVSRLDLSQNKLTTLPAEICNMTRITRLELGSNKIVHLPNNIGQMTNLHTLDLFNNEVEDLPLSFADLKSLKWLDLKKNPMQPPLLLKAAGNCGSDRECKEAAARVVAYMKDRKREHDAEIEQQQAALAKIQDKKKAEKKLENYKRNEQRKKEQAQKAKAQIAQPSGSQQPAKNAQPSQKSKGTKQTTNTKVFTKPEQGSFFMGMFRFFFRLAFYVALGATAAATVTILLDCSDGGKKVAGVKPLCADLTKIASFTKPSSKFTENGFKVYKHIFTQYKNNLRRYYDLFSKEVKKYYGQFAKSSVGVTVDKYLHSIHAFVVEKSLLTHQFIVKKWTELNAWYARDGHKHFDGIVKNIKVASKMVFEIVKDVANWAYKALNTFYHRVEAFIVVWQEKGFAKATETVL